MTVLVRSARAFGLLVTLAGVASVASVASAQLSAPAPAAAAVPKLAYLNSQAILASAPGRADAEALFEKEMATYKSTLTKMQDSLKSMVDAYGKSEATLSAPARKTQGEAIQRKEQEYQTRAASMEQQARQRESELVKPLMEQIQKIIEAVRVEDGYAMIFDVGGNTSVIVGADKSLDITDKVIARLKAAGPITAAAPASAVKPGPTAAPAGVGRPSTKPPAPR
ncbi:MAG: OmpH family outer membrane protein [Gemmatimonadaceae bacterium]